MKTETIEKVLPVITCKARALAHDEDTAQDYISSAVEMLLGMEDGQKPAYYKQAAIWHIQKLAAAGRVYMRRVSDIETETDGDDGEWLSVELTAPGKSPEETVIQIEAVEAILETLRNSDIATAFQVVPRAVITPASR